MTRKREKIRPKMTKLKIEKQNLTDHRVRAMITAEGMNVSRGLCAETA